METPRVSWSLAAALAAVMLAACTMGEEGQPIPNVRSPDAPWPVVWPQESRDEAEQAQDSAHGGDDRYRWQHEEDGEQVASRYAREELGWESFEVIDLHAKDEIRRWRVIRCGWGVNADYPGIDCAPGRGRTYPAFYITVEQLLSQGDEGLWFVTDVLATELRQADPVPRAAARRLVARFLRSRVGGSGAEQFLSRRGRRAFGEEYGEQPLYSPAEGSPFSDYEIAFVGGPLWPDGNFEVGVRVILDSGSALEDTLFLAPGSNMDGKDRPLVVHGLRSGLEGP